MNPIERLNELLEELLPVVQRLVELLEENDSDS